MERRKNTGGPEAEIKNVVNYTGDKGPTIGKRHIQVLALSITGGFGYITNFVLTSAIVAMTDPETSSNSEIPTYDWSNKSVILSSILWSGIAVSLLAGYLGKQYGPKWIVCTAGILNGVIFMLIPMSAAHGGATGVIVCRLFQGIALGFLSPQAAVVSGRWVPPEERARMGFIGGGFITIILTVIASISSGYIASSHVGWPGIFYIFGAIGITTSVIYALVGVQSPGVHRGITPEEKTYIQETLFHVDDNPKTPWIPIFTSIHFWAVVAAQAGSSWLTVMLATEMNLYLNKVMGFSIETIGLIMAGPTLITIVAGTGISILSDLLIKRQVISVRNSRRSFQFIGTFGMSLSLVLLTVIPVEHRSWSVVLLCINDIFVMCFSVGGAALNLLDLSPKYAGITGGVAGTLSQAVSLFAPLTVQWIVHTETEASEWRIVFLVSGAIAVGTSIFFAIFATGKRQNWDGETEQEAKIEILKRRTSVIDGSIGIGL